MIIFTIQKNNNRNQYKAMNRYLFLFLFLSASLIKTSNTKAQSFSGFEITNKGAWCWFADSRATHYENKEKSINNTYIGYIDSHGAIKATQHNHNTGITNEVLIRSAFQPDDHNNPTFLALPDGRIIIFYSRHTDESCFYYRISREPGDITTLGKEFRLETDHNTTYPSPFILSDDPEHIYLCWRGIEWHPTIARLTLPNDKDEIEFNWGPKQIVQSTAARPYAKYSSNGKNKIHLTYTTGHPDNEAVNYVYYNYIDINDLVLKDIKGNTLSFIDSEIHSISATDAYVQKHPDAVVDSAPYRNWIWQVSTDTQNQPVVAMVRISEDKDTHDYYHAKWNGKQWVKTFLTNAGGSFHQTPNLEKCYSGGMAIDSSNSNIIYCSVPQKGDNGLVYEIVKYTINKRNKVTSEPITYNSKKNNIRPYIIPNSSQDSLQLLWMNGDYYDWIVSKSRPLGYPTAIHSKTKLSKASINLTNGLIIKETFNVLSESEDKLLNALQKAQGQLKEKDTKSFSITFKLSMDERNEHGILFTLGNLTCGFSGGPLSKPYIAIDNKVYNSSNVLGTSDRWKLNTRATNGIWYNPILFKNLNFTITYSNGELKTYVNGLIDQSLAVPRINLNSFSLASLNQNIQEVSLYNRALNQEEIKTMSR